LFEPGQEGVGNEGVAAVVKRVPSLWSNVAQSINYPDVNH
jgi:hypothetical protein